MSSKNSSRCRRVHQQRKANQEDWGRNKQSPMMLDPWASWNEKRHGWSRRENRCWKRYRKTQYKVKDMK